MRVLLIAVTLIWITAGDSIAFDLPWGGGDDTAKKTESIHRKALSAYGSADYSKAIKLSSDAIKLDAKFAKGYALRGKAKKDMGDIDNAVKDLDMAISLDPKIGEAYYVRGQVSEIMGEMDKAKADYKKGCSAGFRSACQ